MNIKRRLYNYIYDQHWTLGFIEHPASEIISGKQFEIQYLRDIPSDRWFADPYILYYDDREIHVLVEEFCYSIQRGRIAKLIIGRKDYRLLDFKIILDLPTHLSFPFILKRKQSTFIAPENSESGEWNLYVYDEHSEILKKVRTIVKESLTDAILTNAFGEELIFSTHLPCQNGNALSIYSAEGEFLNTHYFENSIARNAGDWILLDGKVFRPAQDCNGGYGKAVVIQEVSRLENGSFVFKDICRICSTNPLFSTGCHTFNSLEDLSVVDVHGYRRPRLVKVIDFLKQ